MQTEEAIRKRRSVRSFLKKEIPAALIEKIIDLARLAPTAKNIQPWEFVAVTKKETLEKLGELAENGRFIAQSSCCIVVFCQDTKYYLEDGCAATVNILLSAEELGIAACWVAGDKKPYCDEVKRLLKAPQEHRLVSLIPLGYAESKSIIIPSKRPLKEVLHWEKF